MVYSADVGGSTGACVVAARLMHAMTPISVLLTAVLAARPLRCAGGVGPALVRADGIAADWALYRVPCLREQHW